MNKSKIVFFIAAVILLEICFFSNNTAVFASENEDKQEIEDGIYTIVSEANNNYVLDIEQGSTENYANVRLWENANVVNQRFKLEYIGDGYYKIISANSGKVLDVYGGRKEDGTNVQQYEYNYSEAQQWKLKNAGNGSFYIVSRCNDLVLDIPAGRAENGANVQVYTLNGTNAQKFRFKKYEEPKQTIEDGIYTIASGVNNNYVLDIEQGSTDNYANVRLWESANVVNQRFEVSYIGEGYYKIMAMNSKKVLDVYGGRKENGTNVQQYEYNYSTAQQWEIRDAGDGNYYIVSRCNDLVLDIPAGNAQNGTNVQVYALNGTNAQRFKFKKYEEPKQTIENGVYTISSKLKTNYLLDIASASVDNYANIQLWQDSGVDNQKFNVEYIGEGYYKITSIYSQKVLDVYGGRKDSGTNVQQYDYNYSTAQQWQIKDAGNGSYYIISRCNDLALDIESGTVKNGANIYVYEQNGKDTQKFKFKKYEEPKLTIENGTYTISTKLNSKYLLDIAEASRENGANVQLWENSDVIQQRFRLTYAGNGYYNITNINSRKVLDVDNGAGESGTNVKQYQLNGSTAQQWQIKDAEDGSYYIISRCNGLYLTVKDGTAENRANIQVEEENYSNAQKFIFNKIDTSIKIDETKYPGYKEKIEALQKAHPDWNFELLYTGLKFSEATSGESAVHSRNLVPTSYSGEWICSVCGTTLYDSGWYCASEKAIAYYLDPRNFLDEVNIFQFQDVNEYLDEACTLEGIKSQVEGSYLQNYANDIETACRNTNVNPYYIIARLFQEQGRTGTTIGRGMDGGDGKTYYNPFNIGANGNGWETIYANALARAKREGWDSMEKAIEGGIGFCKKNWLENYQNTLYQNRFDIDSTNGTSLYTHQYMQNLMGAYSEARILQSMYGNTNRLESSFTFIIPVYEQMDATSASMPSNTTESSPINVETTGTNVRLRAGASADSQIIMEIAEKGTVLLSIERGVNSDWQKVVLQDGTIGYVSGKFLKQINDVTTCNYTAKVKTNDGYGCNIRIGPGLNGPKLGALADGEQVTVIDNTTYKNIDGYDWYRIIIPDGRQAFIPGKYLK